jgi:hypothetical protein
MKHTYPFFNLKGFGFSGDVDDYTIKVVVEYLKNEVRSTNSFLLLFNGLEKRFTRTTLHWLTSIQNIFGSEIWSYAIIGVQKSDKNSYLHETCLIAH